ncbi:hypothetical protein [Kibdelosporangium philippinense]|uniref:hypothetical protein n=1 Tax=Kibdelosporangium philippinense TaxID=211113 RepID=UPI003623D7CB
MPLHASVVRHGIQPWQGSGNRIPNLLTVAGLPVRRAKARMGAALFAPLACRVDDVQR